MREVHGVLTWSSHGMTLTLSVASTNIFVSIRRPRLVASFMSMLPLSNRSELILVTIRSAAPMVGRVETARTAPSLQDLQMKDLVGAKLMGHGLLPWLLMDLLPQVVQDDLVDVPLRQRLTRWQDHLRRLAAGAGHILKRVGVHGEDGNER